MLIFLEHRKSDICAFKKAIKLCRNDEKTVKVLNKYLREIEHEYDYADYLKKNFIPLINGKENFYRAFIFYNDNGDYRIEVYIHNADEKAKKEYTDIYNNFSYKEEGKDEFFYIDIYDIEKDKDTFNEASDYDKITIMPKKR